MFEDFENTPQDKVPDATSTSRKQRLHHNWPPGNPRLNYRASEPQKVIPFCALDMSGGGVEGLRSSLMQCNSFLDLFLKRRELISRFFMIAHRGAAGSPAPLGKTPRDAVRAGPRDQGAANRAERPTRAAAVDATSLIHV